MSDVSDNDEDEENSEGDEDGDGSGVYDSEESSGKGGNTSGEVELGDDKNEDDLVSDSGDNDSQTIEVDD